MKDFIVSKNPLNLDLEGNFIKSTKDLCNVIWKINFNKKLKLSFFYVSTYENLKEV